jgi:hypothetical protein
MGALPLAVAAVLTFPVGTEARPEPDDPLELYRQQLAEREKRQRARLDRIRAIPPAPPVVFDAIAIRNERLAPDVELHLEEVPAPPLDPDDPFQPAAAARPVIAVAAEDFDRAVLGGINGEQERRDNLNAWLARSVDQAARDHGLSARERERLRLAGRGDIKRFFDAVDERRRQFEAVRTDVKAAIASLRGLRPLASAFRTGPFGGGSLFEKTLTKILQDRQARRRDDLGADTPPSPADRGPR